ncbi:hypothetical protein M5K25_021481 [Dendrobium thyrsiflorum]|uniref:Alkyl hydroperoxide reductase subunit C/ Thiol specific antioxidant domain-containing protein n=1 Tax=Dendrobium thyrsiflorum TaxID=117978 RepID=A0ABD0UCQ7_DENTH
MVFCPLPTKTILSHRFYLLNFTFVCPTEITAFSDRHSEIEKLNTEILGVSVDSEIKSLSSPLNHTMPSADAFRDQEPGRTNLCIYQANARADPAPSLVCLPEVLALDCLRPLTVRIPPVSHARYQVTLAAAFLRRPRGPVGPTRVQLLHRQAFTPCAFQRTGCPCELCRPTHLLHQDGPATCQCRLDDLP